VIPCARAIRREKNNFLGQCARTFFGLAFNVAMKDMQQLTASTRRGFL
jgi:hypothetical protein